MTDVTELIKAILKGAGITADPETVEKMALAAAKEAPQEKPFDQAAFNAAVLRGARIEPKSETKKE